MTIKRKLQEATWSYDEDLQTLSLSTQNNYFTAPDGSNTIVLNRTYAFSLARFLIRVFFRMSMRKRKASKASAKAPDETIES